MFHDDIKNDKYSKLKTLIIERQAFEAEHPFPPYSTHTTDINFTDVDGNALLHYAAMMGDLDKVIDCVNNKADINLLDRLKKSAIELALTNGNLSVADYLYQNGAKCVNLKLEVCKNKKEAEWLIEKISHALEKACPDYSNPGFGPATKNAFFPDKECFLRMLLERAAEINNIEFIKQQNYGCYYNEQLLLIAAANGHLPLIEYLINKGANINISDMYHSTPLINAIKNKQNEAIDFLLGFKEIDINKQDANKLTPIMHSILQNNSKMVYRLLDLNADITRENVNGNNILHYAAITKEFVFSEKLFNCPEVRELIKHENIYGQTPLDLAFAYNNRAFIEVFVPEMDSKEIDKALFSAVKPVVIAQYTIMKRILYFLRLNYRDISFFDFDGHCSGLSFLRNIYASRGMDEYFFETLALISSWDGEQPSLLKPFKEIPQSVYYSSLYELIEQWSNDIFWFQHALMISTLTGYLQQSRFELYQFIKDKPDDDVHTLYSEQGFFRSEEQIREIFSYFMRMPNHILLEISGGEHNCTGHKNKLGLFSYYDSNFLHKTTGKKDIYENLRKIIDYKYITLKRFFVTMDCKFHIYCFKKDMNLINLNSFNIFSENEFPKNQDEASQFQLASPNRFTHLHVAVMTRSLPAIERLLKDGFCDPYATNKSWMTALEMAEFSQFHEAVELFNNSIDVSLIRNSDSTIMVL